ncbi:MAG: hypothetical protein P794_08335 [Epsilonproteobacteria bacterium (ex Lamellibrachia satsuma)]|nr:MAG: hypothetical protein P794_08335 [Epsilonproteobacteria bacterium (ex Lamellibrachia satsuma)]
MKKIDIGRIIEQYPTLHKSFDKAFIGIPKGVGGLKKSYYGKLNKFLKKYPDFKAKASPCVLYMHGSSGFLKGKKYRKWIVKKSNMIFIALNSFAIQNRPTYMSPAPKKDYEAVHMIRQAELKYALSHLNELSFIDRKNLFLMGNSEGALAAGICRSKCYKGRILVSWGCEGSYYSKDYRIGAKKAVPILNIIGLNDQYFGVYSELGDFEKGHCAKALQEFGNSKVVLLPQITHNALESLYTKQEIVNFLNYWKKQ